MAKTSELVVSMLPETNDVILNTQMMGREDDDRIRLCDEKGGHDWQKTSRDGIWHFYKCECGASKAVQDNRIKGNKIETVA